MLGNKLRTIYFDLEITVDLAQVPDVWFGISDYPGRSMGADVNSILCFGWRVEGEKTQIKSAWDFPGWKRNINDDYALCKFAYDILKDADIIITQNGKSFDWRFLQTRLLIHKLGVLPKIMHIDTKLVSRSNLFLTSKSLKRLAELFTTERKMQHEGKDLWTKVRKKIPSALKTMEKYCKQDVNSLVEIYHVLRPLPHRTINRNQFLHTDEHGCSECGSKALLSKGWRHNQETSYRRLRCSDCGTWNFQDTKGRIKRL